MSPATELRERWGLNRTEMALALGISYPRWCAFESGNTGLTRDAWGPLRELGADPASLDLAQREWREAQSRAKRAELLDRLSGQLRMAE